VPLGLAKRGDGATDDLESGLRQTEISASRHALTEADGEGQLQQDHLTDRLTSRKTIEAGVDLV
jgi:hypothetical protein